MVILATNMEKVEEEKGIDEIVRDITLTCRKNKVPLVFSMPRYRLGCLAKYKGQYVSACGIMNYQSANDEFNQLVQALEQARDSFYMSLAAKGAEELKLQMRENDFYNWANPHIVA